MRLKLTWPRMANPTHCENFYLGGWHPYESITLERMEPPSAIRPFVITSKNWFLMSNVSRLHTHHPGLIHAAERVPGTDTGGVAFSGYLLSPPIHSYSPSKEILEYWLNESASEHNGVFSAVRIRDSGHMLELITDAFGMAPLCYRRLGDLVLFASNPRYLTANHDEPDYAAWRCRIQADFIAADRTLSVSIKRVPAGRIVRFHGGKVEDHTWFDYGVLPRGTQEIDEDAVASVEEAFQNAMSRCLELKGGSYFLPLSSGYDSRRILASLLHRKIAFEAATVRRMQKGHRDLDARYASLMAKELGFPHRVVDWLGPREYIPDDYQRRILLDSESRHHSWAVRLMGSLPDYPTFFLDGLAGDVLGNGDLLVPGLLYDSPESDKALFVQYSLTNEYDGILNPGVWPSVNDLRTELDSYIDLLPRSVYQTTLAYLLLRTRRTIAPWASQMLPAGHVVVCPFLDLDYLRTTLSYSAVEKFHASFQEACLERYWPRLLAYHGTHSIPSDIPPGSPWLENERELACFRRLQEELIEGEGMSRLTGLLRKKARLKFWLARKNDRVALRLLWDFGQLMELVCREVAKEPCWDLFHEN